MHSFQIQMWKALVEPPVFVRHFGGVRRGNRQKKNLVPFLPLLSIWDQITKAVEECNMDRKRNMQEKQKTLGHVVGREGSGVRSNLFTSHVLKNYSAV